MFGLKVVNKRSYLDLQDELNWYKKVASEKETKIANLEGEVKGLRSEVSRLEKKVETLETSKKATNDAILLTDVAESPLVVEKKTKKRTKVTKKSGETTKRKKIVHKTDVTE